MLFGDEVAIVGDEVSENDFRFEIKNGEKTSCRARMLFSPINQTKENDEKELEKIVRF